jgi:uncharacterized protein DUF6879
MPEAPQRFDGDQLSLDEYIDDYYAHFWHLKTGGSWKLERQQTFRELDNPSWEASDCGEWARALELLDEGRDSVREYQEKIRDHEVEFRRVRIVEKPYSPYLIWELNSLLIRHEYGERIRALPANQLGDLESDEVLPEILALGTEVVYQVIYDKTGTATGAVRSTDQDTVRSWTTLIAGLYDRAENLPDFFTREVAGLRPAHA